MPYKTNLLSLLLLCILLVSCSKKKELSFDSILYTAKDFDCNEDCPEISIQQLQAVSSAKEKQAIVSNINQTLNEHLIYSLFSYDENIGDSQDVKAAIQHFITGYQQDKIEYPDMLAIYEANIKSELLHQTENMLSLQVTTYLYTGGAHGYSNISYQNFNPENGYPIAIEQSLVDIDVFIDFVEIKFKEAFDIPESSSINSTRFMFDGDVFKLPVSIGFDKDNMLFTYNPYEIAPYFEGPIELKIPISEVQVFLNIAL